MAKILVGGVYKVYQSPGTIVYHELQTDFGLWARQARIHSYKEVMEDDKVVGVNYLIRYTRDFPVALMGDAIERELFSDLDKLYEVDSETVIPKPLKVSQHEANSRKEVTPDGDRASRRDWR